VQLGLGWCWAVPGALALLSAVGGWASAGRMRAQGEGCEHAARETERAEGGEHPCRVSQEG
jgi:hypothetical protein